MEVGSAVQTQITWAPSARGRRSRHQASAALALSPSTAARRVRCRAMQQQERPPAVRTVTIPFADLKEREKDLGDKIEEGLGPHGLGIISIADVPDFPELRKTLLRLAPRHVIVDVILCRE
nr:unnamed protein product [Digitaria exilis]